MRNRVRRPYRFLKINPLAPLCLRLRSPVPNLYIVPIKNRGSPQSEEKKNIAEAKKSLFEKTICYAKKSVQIIEQIQENVIFHAFL